MKVITRKKGTKKYFYLKHSFRKDGKVMSREIYLGTEIPKNIDKIKEELEEEQKKELADKLERIRNNFQSEWKKIPESVKQQEKEEIAIAFTYNTNAIEGSTITLAEAREIIHDKISPRKPLKDVRETETHAKVFLSMLDEKSKIDVLVILKWHRKIFGETKPDIAGKLRRYLIRVGSYVAPDWQDVEKLMGEFISFLKIQSTNPVEFAARAHYKFEKIHPFGDGNGRIGRLIMNHILWHSGYPMIIIEYKKRRAYYHALEKGEEKFVKYFLRRYLTAHKKRILNR